MFPFWGASSRCPFLQLSPFEFLAVIVTLWMMLSPSELYSR